MKFLLRVAPLAVLTLALAAGCKKKPAVDEVAGQAESKLPAGEQMPLPSPAPGVKTGSAEDRMLIGGVPAAAAPEDTTQNADFEAWFRKYKLDLNDPAMLDADPDGDGASNRDEFLSDTNPTDANSRPGIHKSIRLKEYAEVKLPIILRDVKGGVAEIERLDKGGGRMEKVRVGDTVPGSSLKVAKVESRLDTDKHGEKIDLSQLVLTDPATSEKLVLVRDLPVKTSATSARLISADGAASLSVKEGETFSWPAEPGSSYKVMDLREDQVVIKDMGTGQMWTVPRE